MLDKILKKSKKVLKLKPIILMKQKLYMKFTVSPSCYVHKFIYKIKQHK